jgi:hypothetical protein
MVLKFLDKPFTARNPRGAENVAARQPAGALPIGSAPENSYFVAVRANGEKHWAVRHRGTVQYYKPTSKDLRGNTRWGMAGAISDATWWLPQRRG